MMHKFKFLAAATAAVVMLSGCGGGGGAAGTTETFAADAAWNNLFAASRTWRLAGNDNFGNAWVIDLAMSLLADGSYPNTGAAARLRNLDSSIALGGVPQGSGTTTYYLDPTTNALIGVRTVDNTTGEASCATMVNAALPPSAARPGQAGSLATWTSYDGCSGSSAPTGSGSSTWRVVAEDGINYFCMESGSSGGGSSSSEQDCFQIDTAGNIGTRGRITLVETTPSARFELVARTL